MSSKLLSSKELEGLRYLNDEAEDLRRRAAYLITSLVNEFGAGHSVGGLPAMSITKADGPRVLGEITSRFGNGRFFTQFRTEGAAVKAQLVVERATHDRNGQETWEPVLAIPLPKPVWEVDSEPIRDSDKTFMLGASILHAIINGAAEG
jgi:hypothetical protein